MTKPTQKISVGGLQRRRRLFEIAEARGSVDPVRGAALVEKAIAVSESRVRAQALSVGPDDEKFCPKCFAGTESSEHFESCVPR